MRAPRSGRACPALRSQCGQTAQAAPGKPGRYAGKSLRVAAALVLGSLALLGTSCRPAENARQPEVVTTAGGVEMVVIPAGSFRMGSARSQPDQQPVHEVWVDSLLMDRYEVTQAQYTKLGTVNGSHFKGPDRPVEMISWAEAALYCNMRSRAEGLTPCYDEDTTECNFEADGYRLPTEAEWEYACRAGTEGDFSFGPNEASLGDYAWYRANAVKKTHPVGKKKPNPWGLYDMYGNVAEWCNDAYAADYYRNSPARNPRGPKEGDRYVLRGGAWNSSAEGCRSSSRVGETPGFQDSCFARDAIGFRCVRRAPAKAGEAKGNDVRRGSPPVRRGSPDPAETTDREVSAASGRPAVVLVARSGGWPQQESGDRPQHVRRGSPDPAETTRRTGFVYGPIYLEHKTGQGHPERPERLTAMVERLKKSGLFDELAPIEPRPAADEWLTAVHSPEHVAAIRKAAEETSPWVGSRDTPVSRQSYQAAIEAAGGVMAAIDAVVAGKVRNAFCAVRPPGHHASKDRAMGFCLLNNVAIAARYAQKKHNLKRVLIVDWDAHHGNGTQAVFDDDPTVFYFSAHQSPFYPGTGSAGERGQGKAVGTKLNVPLPAGSGDAEYRRAFEDQLVPAAGRFKPDLVLISAGFDAHEDDPLGSMKLTAAGYAELTRIVKGIAEEQCEGRLVSVLEGGYDLDGLAASVEAHLRVLMQ